MTDIWDGKPTKRGGAFMGDDFEWRDPHYDDDEVDAFFKKLQKHIEWLQSYVDANQLITNQFAFHDDKYWWNGVDLSEMQDEADKLKAVTAWVEENKHERIDWDNWKDLLEILGDQASTETPT